MSKIEEYIANISPERRGAFVQLRAVIAQGLPEGFEECMQYGMISWVVPKSIYPKGYHAKPSDALPFISLASQKNYFAVYHMALYSDENLLKWFKEQYAKQCKTKLDMGKSCIRLKKLEDIPFELIGELASKVGTKQWIEKYEKALGGR